MLWMPLLMPLPLIQSSGFRVQGSGFRVQESEFRVQGSGLTVQGAGFREGRRLPVDVPHM